MADLDTRREGWVVRTDADPDPHALMVARGEIRRDPALANLFHQFSKEERDVEWLADNLAVRLSAKWGGHDFSTAMQAARYLADEYEQVVDGCDVEAYVVDTRTGRLVSNVRASDVYQPAPVPRESGNMASPVPRLDPQLEAQLIQEFYEQARERQLEAQLARKIQQTDALRTQGDRRLRLATRDGRRTTAEEIREVFLENLLTERGPASHLLNLMPFSDRAPAYGVSHFVRSTSVVEVPIQDVTTVNPYFDRCGQMISALYRELALQVARSVVHLTKDSSMLEAAGLDEICEEPCRLWLASPSLALQLQRRKLPVRAVEGATVVVGLAGVAGAVCATFQNFSSFELHDKWRVRVEVDLTTYLWADEVRVFAVEPEPEPHLALVVR